MSTTREEAANKLREVGDKIAVALKKYTDSLLSKDSKKLEQLVIANLDEAMPTVIHRMLGIERNHWDGFRVTYDSPLKKFLQERSHALVRQWLDKVLADPPQLSEKDMLSLRKVYLEGFREIAHEKIREYAFAEAEKNIEGIVEKILNLDDTAVLREEDERKTFERLKKKFEDAE